MKQRSFPSKNARGSVKRRPGSTNNTSAVRGNLTGMQLNAVSSLTRVSESYMPLFPPRTQKILRYATNVGIAVSGGAVTTHVFRANDLFDPDYTATGHQPMGFDQMMVFYNHFHVTRSSIKVVANNTAAGCIHAGVRVDASLTPLTSADQIREFGGCTIEILEAKNTYGCAKEFSMSADINRLQGIWPRSAIVADAALGGDAGTSPVENTYYHVFAYDPNSISGTVNYDVIIEFEAIFSEPRDATLSLTKTVKPPLENKEPPPTGKWVLVPS